MVVQSSMVVDSWRRSEDEAEKVILELRSWEAWHWILRYLPSRVWREERGGGGKRRSND